MSESTQTLFSQLVDKYGPTEASKMYRQALHEARLTAKPKQLKPLPAEALADILSGELTVAELFQHFPEWGKPEEYDLSQLTEVQKGNLAVLKEPQAINWAELATEAPNGDGFSNPGGQPGVVEPPIIKPTSPGGKIQLEQYVKDHLKSGEWTLVELLKEGVLPGKASDYDLAEFTPSQIGELPIGQAAKIR